MKYMLFLADNNVSFPGSESMKLEISPSGYAIGTNIVKANTKNEFSQDAQGVIRDMQQVNIQEKETAASAAPDPFLVDNFQNLIKETGVGVGSVQAASKQLNDAQRVALARGDLDEAIALGNRRV
jgi:hypothetical protein